MCSTLNEHLLPIWYKTQDKTPELLTEFAYIGVDAAKMRSMQLTRGLCKNKSDTLSLIGKSLGNG